MYTDDTQICESFNAANVDLDCNLNNSVLEYTSDYYLNISNTKLMLCVRITGRNKSNIVIKIDNASIKPVDSYKNLDLFFDIELKFRNHSPSI